MPELKIPLRESLSVTFVSPGRGAVLFQPAKFNERWEIATATVVTNSAILQPRASFYRDGSEIPSSLINGTYGGAFDTDTMFNYVLYPGNILRCIWTLGDVGATGTCILTGNKVFSQ